jgi:hypothetical protein
MEMRAILINADDDFRSHIIWQLQTWSTSKETRQNWSRQVEVFFAEVWPRQKSAKTSRITVRLCELVLSDRDIFSERTELVLPFLTKIDHEVRQYITGLDDELVDLYPEKTLALLWAILPEEAAVWPYGAEMVLERIAAADPSLRRDPRLFELNRRWNAR